VSERSKKIMRALALSATAYPLPGSTATGNSLREGR
jgi:hypothetical protein